MNDREAKTKAHGAESASTAGLGLVERLDLMAGDMAENREPTPMNWREVVLEAAREMRRLRDSPRAVSAEADFDAMTWTFQIGPECRVAAGTYALVWIPPARPTT